MSDSDSSRPPASCPQAAFSPAFIHRPEGRRFLASLFNLDKDFVGELTAIIKNQASRSHASIIPL